MDGENSVRGAGAAFFPGRRRAPGVRLPPHTPPLSLCLTLSLSFSLQLTALFVYRVMESGARIAALAVFASVAGAWLFGILAGHAAAVVALLAAQRPPRRANGGFGAASMAGVGGGGGAVGGGPPKPWGKVFRIARVPLPSPSLRHRAVVGPAAEGAANLATLGGGSSPGKGCTPTPPSHLPLKARLLAHLPGFTGGGEGAGGGSPAPGPALGEVPPQPPPHSCALPVALPRSTDAALLAACLAWPPSFYVSDATDRSGAFWWRARMLGRKSCASVAPGTALVPFAPYTSLVAAEAAIMLGVAWAKSPPWATPYVASAVVLHLLWGLSGALWLTAEVAAASDGGAADAALERAAVGAEAAALAAELAAVEAAAAAVSASDGGDDLEAGRGGGPPPGRLLAAGSWKAGRRASEPAGAPGVHQPAMPPAAVSAAAATLALACPAPDEVELARAASTPVRGRHGSAGGQRSAPASPRYTADGDAVAMGSPSE